MRPRNYWPKRITTSKIKNTGFVMHECDKDKVIDMIRDDLKEIKRDIKDLLAFKWQLIGICIAVSTIISIGVKVVEAIAREGIP
jgi:hypothetical protein